MSSTGLLGRSRHGAGGIGRHRAAGTAPGRGNGRPRAYPSSWWILGLAVVLAAGAGVAATLGQLYALLAVAVVVLIAAVARWPVLATYLIVVVTPLTVGISSGASLPLRPNEVVDALVGVGLVAGILARLRAGEVPRLRLGHLEWSMLLMAVCSSVLPLLLMAVRLQQITKDDLLYAIVMWKLLGLYTIVRLSVRTDEQIRRCLWLSVAAGCVVALGAIAQSLNIAGLGGMITSVFGDTAAGPVTPGARGGSTLGLPAAVADLMIFNLAIATGLWTRYRRHPLFLAGAAVLFVFGAVSAGEFSGYIGLVVGVVFIAIVTRSTKLLGYCVPAGLAGVAVLWPVVSIRLNGFHSAYGLPTSWLGRLSNLRTYFWPKLLSHWNFALGVRPAARVPVLTQNPAYVWIESGYTWLLWAGGIPFLASYVYFTAVTVKRGWDAARHETGALSVAGAAAFVAVLVTAVLMLFDPHLTYRGSADLLFVLIALAATRSASSRGTRPGSIPETNRTASRGGSTVSPEHETRSTANGAPASWGSALSPDGNARGSRVGTGPPGGPDAEGTGVNPRAPRRDPRAPGQLPRFLRAHLASIVVITLAVTAIAAVVAGLQTRQYKSQAAVVVYPSAAEAGTGVQATLMGTEEAVATSGTVVGAAARSLHVPVSTLQKGLSVNTPANSYLLDITYTNPNPHVAQRYAQAVARAYEAYRTPPKHKGTAAGTGTAAGAAATSPTTDSVEATTVTPASFPVAPSSPNVALDVGAGLILGIVLGLGYALARDRTDDRLRGPADLEDQSGARVLAVIPGTAGGKGPASGLAVVRDPGSETAGAFRDLRTRVLQAATWQKARTILVASPEGEDEALVPGNLAAALALAGQHVVLVCADPRRTGTQELFGVTASTGLTGVLTGDASLASAVQRTEVPGLEILTAGPAPADMATVMTAGDMSGVISGIRGWADFVVIEAPAVLDAPESSVLAELADMVLLAADDRNSTRTSVRAATGELEQVHPVLDGCVLAESRGLGAVSAGSRWDAGSFRDVVGRAGSRVPPPAWRPSLVRIVRHGAGPDDD
jgi:Mrp family chromosome partitioning ATPase/capsular polysaccharide biosynthesis protein